MKPISVQSGVECLSHELHSEAIHTCCVCEDFLSLAFVACSKCQNAVIEWPCPWAWMSCWFRCFPKSSHLYRISFVFLGSPRRENIRPHGHFCCLLVLQRREGEKNSWSKSVSSFTPFCQGFWEGWEGWHEDKGRAKQPWFDHLLDKTTHAYISTSYETNIRRK